MNMKALSQVRQPLDRRVSVQLKASGRRQKREAAPICRFQTVLENMGSLVKVPTTAPIHFYNHLSYSLEPSFVPAVVFSCAMPADKIWQAQTRGELGEPH